MVMRLGALEDALIDAGASPQMATKAAEELAGYDRVITSMNNNLTLLTGQIGHIEGKVAGVDAIAKFTLGLVMLTLGCTITAIWKIAELAAVLHR